MKPHHHQPRIVIPGAVIRVATFIGYGIAGAAIGQLIGMLLFY